MALNEARIMVKLEPQPYIFDNVSSRQQDPAPLYRSAAENGVGAVNVHVHQPTTTAVSVADGTAVPVGIVGRGFTYLERSSASSDINAANLESPNASDSFQQGYLDDLFKYDEESDSEDESSDTTHPYVDDLDQQVTWTEQAVTNNVPIFSAEEGPNFSNFKTCGPAQAMDFFHLFFPEDLYKQAQIETNNFAEYYQEKKRDLGREWWEWCDETWEPVDFKQEIRVFIGICITMAVHALPDPRDYWSTQENLGSSVVAESSMSVERFDRIMHYFCLSNPWKDPEKIANLERRDEACSRDPLYKVSTSLLEYVKSSCINLYNPHQDVVMRELTGIVDHKTGRRTNGWKLLVLQDAITGYISNVQWYRDPTSGLINPNVTYKHAVNSLVKSLEGKAHCVYADNLYISPTMACQCIDDHNIHITTNSSNWPNGILNPDQDLKTGTSKSVHHNQVTATVWRGKKVKRCLSTLYNCFMQPVTQKIRNATTGQHAIETVLCPAAISKHMSLTNNTLPRLLLSQSSVLRDMTNTWWKRLVWLLIDICVDNAYVMWTATTLKHFSRSEFAMEVASQLILGPASKEHPQFGEADCKNDIQVQSTSSMQHSKVSTPVPPTYQLVMNQHNLLEETSGPDDLLQPQPHFGDTDLDEEHCLVKFPGRGRNCRLCIEDNTRTVSGRRRDTQFGCFTCGLNLCRSGCFVRYHEIHKYKINPLTLTKTQLSFDPPPQKRKKYKPRVK
ncbi:piggyBac transposable element-derived protein 4-like [Asterias amurensis]|uniref:piggyBac transposable element-derived protein 4-like n=1 Tax=Asterias amurensis TaxID=7602 RepID=UPI003AB7A0A6